MYVARYGAVVITLYSHNRAPTAAKHYPSRLSKLAGCSNLQVKSSGVVISVGRLPCAQGTYVDRCCSQKMLRAGLCCATARCTYLHSLPITATGVYLCLMSYKVDIQIHKNTRGVFWALCSLSESGPQILCIKSRVASQFLSPTGHV